MGDALGATGDFPGAPSVPCPVPSAQQPLQQYQELRDSWYFAWPRESLAGLLRPLAPVSYTHLTLPTTIELCRSRGSREH